MRQHLKYDSSIFPVKNHRYGISDAKTKIHTISTKHGNLWEFPISTVRIMGQNIPIAGGAYFRIFPYQIIRSSIDRLNSEGQPSVFYIHPWECDTHHPSIRLPFLLGATHYYNLRSTFPKLKKLLSDFKFAPMREVLNLE